MQISTSAWAKDLKEFNLWGSHKEICLQTMKIRASSPYSQILLSFGCTCLVTGSKAKFKHFWKDVYSLQPLFIEGPSVWIFSLLLVLSPRWALPLDLSSAFCTRENGGGEGGYTAIQFQCQCHLLTVCVCVKHIFVYFRLHSWKRKEPEFSSASFASNTCVGILSICLLGQYKPDN